MSVAAGKTTMRQKVSASEDKYMNSDDDSDFVVIVVKFSKKNV